MRKSRIFQRIGMVLGIGLIICVFIWAQFSTNQWSIENVEINFEYSENQYVVREKVAEEMVLDFLSTQPDSAALSMDLHLLETSLESLPYVAEAQVYWNLNSTLIVELRATQARAKIFMEQSKYLLTQEGAVLPAPKFAQIDLPVCTGLKDSAEAAQSAQTLDIIEGSSCHSLSNIAQVHFEHDAIIITPRGAEHQITTNRDKRLANDLEKLAAFYAAKSEEELATVSHFDLRYKNQVVTTVQ